MLHRVIHSFNRGGLLMIRNWLNQRSMLQWGQYFLSRQASRHPLDNILLLGIYTVLTIHD